ncbi:MAG: hydrogenase nickel incorporation protein HypA [Candidatus Aenigmarchaeota archaeon]|nr:hydrogenase nickel incorporation protein HypA [Candidatus Aenigmarchaeota archaeon]
MHEWALAEGVISTAVKAAEKEGLKKIIEIKIQLGELQQIEIGVFEGALNQIVREETPLLKDTKMTIEIEKAILKCRACGCEWPFEDSTKELDGDASESIHFVPEVAHVFIRCIQCKSPDFEVIKGRGVWLKSVEGERE